MEVERTDPGKMLQEKELSGLREAGGGRLSGHDRAPIVSHNGPAC